MGPKPFGALKVNTNIVNRAQKQVVSHWAMIGIRRLARHNELQLETLHSLLS